MNAWAVVVVAGAGSFLFRLSIVALIDHISTPDWVERLSAHVVPAAFAGLAAAALAGPIGAGGLDALPPTIAVLVTAGVAMRRSSIHVSFLSGLAALWATTALISML